jgi:hypothetical protein
MIMVRPRNRLKLARVVTKGLIPTFATMNPLKNPAMVPAKIPLITAGTTGRPFFISRAVAAPVKATREPTDISKPPETIRFVIATAMRASIERLKSKARRFPELKKYGDAKDIITNMPTTTVKIINSR